MKITSLAILGIILSGTTVLADNGKPRARDIGLEIGTIAPGKYNAITDVEGVRVGHHTVNIGDDVRTGITAIIPSDHDMYRYPVPAWIHSGNGYGKLIGETQAREFGEIETPIILGCTLCVWTAAESMKDWLLSKPGEGQHTINPIVGETNDSRVNNMWNKDAMKPEYTVAALENAKTGSVEEGSVGAGRGTQAFGWKGGIGTSSRVLPESMGGYTVGVLVQTNYGGELMMNGAPVGRELGQYSYKTQLEQARAGEVPMDGGSIMIVVATDAPILSRNLDRLAKRGMMGLARTGSIAHNSSGDYVIAFSTNPDVRRDRGAREPVPSKTLTNSAMSPLFQAVVEATQEAIFNAMLKAETVTSTQGTLEAIDVDKVKEILEKYNVTNYDQKLSPVGGQN
ncbi:P1 family peptidase [Pseudemcibacter aquimaris]|uniref:P1 family peptidase n=1 Tax=Pseudemcibacter aquimaris TaxID=2857064 RepID=UPI0020113522|nr:P1 family peptidase [Pseudemcibacter aquimaris]MCC3860763.1 P1 family peptidase [Pseudemcibacter aquimaris]WDU59581.1 P1 family peptidase [Pseudemcibacter aquimaris]